MASLLEQHANLSDDLASFIEEKSLLDAAIVQTRAKTFDTEYFDGRNVTTIKEMAFAASAQFSSESIKLAGKIDSLRVTLHHIELRLQYEKVAV